MKYKHVITTLDFHNNEENYTNHFIDSNHKEHSWKSIKEFIEKCIGKGVDFTIISHNIYLND